MTSIVIIRSSDGKQDTIEIPAGLSKTTLHNLKDLIHDSSLGPLSRQQQRLFHLGKELKSGNRSLEALGIGRFNVFSVHLHSLRSGPNGRQDSEEDEVEVVDVKGQNSREGTRGRGQTEDKVVDLLDSDSDDDVEVVEVRANKRRRKNEVTID